MSMDSTVNSSGILKQRNERKRKNISVSFAEDSATEERVTRTKLNPDLTPFSSTILDQSEVRHLKSMRRLQREHQIKGEEVDEIPVERLQDSQYDDENDNENSDDENTSNERHGSNRAGGDSYGTKKTFVGENMISDSRNLQSSDLDDSIPIEPFNMEEERTDGTGYFDGDTYIFRRNDDENEDAWLENVNTNNKSSIQNKLDNSISLASSLLHKTEKERQQKKRTDSATPLHSKEQCYQIIVSKLAHEKETVLQAIQRFGNLVRKVNKDSRKNRKRKSTSNQSIEMNTVAQQSLDQLTDCAQACLLEYNDNSIYQRNKQFFEKEISSFPQKFRHDTNTGNGSANVSKDKITIHWEYMGNDVKDKNKVQGPFTTQQMLSWIQAGYFVGANAVQVRQIVTNSAPQSSITTNENRTENKDQLKSMLEDLEDSDDEDKVEDNATTKDESNDVNITRGEWMSSDKVSFASYL